MANDLLASLLSGGNAARNKLTTLLTDPRKFLAEVNQDAGTSLDQQRARAYQTLAQRDPALAGRTFPSQAQSDRDWLDQQSQAASDRELESMLQFLGVGAAPVNKIAKKVLKDPVRSEFPGIYKDPRQIAQEAEARLAPEDPNLKRLWGVTRADIYEMSKRPGNMQGTIPGAPANPKGSAAAQQVMTGKNAQRLLDILGEGKTHAPGVIQGMSGWYYMDPMYQQMAKLMGPERAKSMYMRLNGFGGIESPNLPVTMETNRATAANWLAEQGRWDDWVRMGGLKDKAKQVGVDIPQDMMSIPGRVGHERAHTSQAKVLAGQRYGGMESPKAPAYIDASGVPETGFQTDLPVGDAHWSRGVGMADVRTSKGYAESVSTPEILDVGPWFRENVAAPAGMHAVPGQANLWGMLAPQTGVKTAIGAPKLELYTGEIMRAIPRLEKELGRRITPEEARDLIITGQARSGR